LNAPDAHEMMGDVMFRKPLFTAVWGRLRGAYAEDFTRLLESCFDGLGHCAETRDRG